MKSQSEGHFENVSGQDIADTPSFEDSLAELEAIVRDLEEGQLGLAEALARYEQGVKHLKHCYQLLQGAERKIELLTGVAADGTPITQPFSEEGQSTSAGRRRRSKPVQSPAEPSASESGSDIDASPSST